MMLIDRAVHQDFFRVSGWVGNLAILIEHEFFGMRGPRLVLRGSLRREGPTIRGLTVARHLARRREKLIPLAECCGRVMREALASLEARRGTPSEAVERSRPAKMSSSRMLFSAIMLFTTSRPIWIASLSEEAQYFCKVNT
jgi:hypothetical protein